MKITNNPAPQAATNTSKAPAAESSAGNDRPGGPRVTQDGLQSDTLKPAQAALAEMPEIDEARVAEIKAAMADGRIQFDAAKLAGLIRRYHGG